MNFKCSYFDNFDVMLVHFCGLKSEGKEDIKFLGMFSLFKIPKDSDRAIRMNMGIERVVCVSLDRSWFKNMNDTDYGGMLHSH